MNEQNTNFINKTRDVIVADRIAKYIAGKAACDEMESLAEAEYYEARAELKELLEYNDLSETKRHLIEYYLNQV